MKNLYNEDGSLRSNVRELVSPKPDNVSVSDRRKQVKAFTSQLSTEEFAEFIKIRRRETEAVRRIKSPEKVKKCRAKWRHKNPQKMKNINASWRKANPVKLKEYDARAYAKDPKKIIARSLEWRYNRLKKDPQFRFFETLRSACKRVVKQLSLGKKPVSTFKWVGCSPEELKARFESLFVEGMSWDNYGEWHIDHIRPVSSFKPEEWEQINHYTNLQPLWAQDNLKKGDKY
jgi:hypothetical protein